MVFNQIKEILKLSNEAKVELNVTCEYKNTYRQLDLVIHDEFWHKIIETKNYNDFWKIGTKDYELLTEKLVSFDKKYANIVIITKNGSDFTSNINNSTDFEFINLTDWLENELYK